MHDAKRAYLSLLGERVRAWRSEHGMTRKALSAASGVSERYLAQLEAGEGNISVLLLRKVARAMGVPVESLVREDASRSRSASPSSACAARASRPSARSWPQSLGVPFIELDREVEKEAGAALGEVFAMYGQDAFRRFERRALERVLAQNERAVIATGGSLVTDAGTYKLLLERCCCVWLKASPEEHMARVIAQGDMRPFKGRSAGAGRDPQAARRPRPALQPRRSRTWTRPARSARSSLSQLTCPGEDMISLRNPARPLPPLEAGLRRPGRHAHARRRRGQAAGAGLQAQAQQLRPRRRHRARRRAEPHPLRASRGEGRGDHQRQEPHVLLGRQHLHARPLEPRLEGELLQVHQRDAQRHRGRVARTRASSSSPR